MEVYLYIFRMKSMKIRKEFNDQQDKEFAFSSVLCVLFSICWPLGLIKLPSKLFDDLTVD